MIKRIVLMFVIFIVAYTGIVRFQVFIADKANREQVTETESESEPSHRVYAFSFTKYTSGGEKEIEIEGDSANILARNVLLSNVVAKAYAEETPVTITADQGNYDKSANMVHLKKNVVATTENGTRLLTEELDIYPEDRVMESGVGTEVKKDNISVDGVGARGDSNLKKVKFKRNVTVVVQDPKELGNGPTIITCDGPLIVDYEKNIAHFKNNVVAEDYRGKLMADEMDVYYNKVSRQVSKIVATGNVMIENPDRNRTFSDSVIYLADEGRIILGGDTEALYYQGEEPGEDLLY
ncbi:MAG: LPS export ABC transporter periplasmic protein LptC [Candidatus Omnitrophica bacterium]|nr:LPS export ABC transporter periplasmic protein LptC [Candidatus Omnitrophota bacterium]